MDMDGDNEKFSQPVMAECAGCKELYPYMELKKWLLGAITGRIYVDLCPECHAERARIRKEYGW